MSPFCAYFNYYFCDMLSVTCKAAIKAVIFLGVEHPSGQRYSIGEIADRIGENEHTVGKLLQKLVRAGIICSAKGPNGGFYITEAQRAQPVIHVVEAIDGQDMFTECGLGFHTCSERRPCPFHQDFKKVREGFYALCRERKIAELDNSVISGKAFLNG